MKRKQTKPKRLRRPAAELVADAFARHERGELEAAEELYREAVRQKPDHDRALGLLAMLIGERDPAEAAALLARAIAVAPSVAWYHLSLGHARAAAGDDAGAVQAMTAAAARDVESAIPRYDLARHHLRHGRTPEALAALREVLACEPAHPRATFLIASLSGAHVDAPPAEFVTELFDSYAPGFETHLVDVLGYRAPEQLAALVAADGHAPAPSWQILDLGCGSGLTGVAFKPYAKHLVGSDLSVRMLELARARGVYDELHAEDLLATLARARAVDLVVAADVFIYVGALAAAFAAIARALRPGGLFAFSVERGDGDGFQLLPTSRYAHGEAYIAGLAAQHGFTVRARQDIALRADKAGAIPGALYLLQH